MKKELYKKIGEAVKRERVNAGFTQGALGKYLGKSRSTVVSIEKGSHALSIETLYLLSELFDKQPGYFLPDIKSLSVKSSLPKGLERELNKIPGIDRIKAKRLLLSILSNSRK